MREDPSLEEKMQKSSAVSSSSFFRSFFSVRTQETHDSDSALVGLGSTKQQRTQEVMKSLVVTS